MRSNPASARYTNAPLKGHFSKWLFLRIRWYRAATRRPGAIVSKIRDMTRKLHIGGRIAAPGWEILDANAAPFVDHTGNAKDLSRFTEDTFSDVYASHVLEHFDFAGELLAVLQEWKRVLEPGGRLHVSVPDLDVLAALLLDRQSLDFDDRFHVMAMIFGGHVDRFDYHAVGLNEDILGYYLTQAGYTDLRKVGSLGLFDDTSEMVFKGKRISLNMIAQKPVVPEVTAVVSRAADAEEHTRRNDPCPCGSGKRFKHCHGLV
jgi:predicted SAM-dependent methyltransferase